MPNINELIDEKLTRGNDFAGLVGLLKIDTDEYRDPQEYLDEYRGRRYRRRSSVDHLEVKSVTVYSEDEVDGWHKVHTYNFKSSTVKSAN